jgi:hypothetical protein
MEKIRALAIRLGVFAIGGSKWNWVRGLICFFHGRNSSIQLRSFERDKTVEKVLAPMRTPAIVSRGERGALDSRPLRDCGTRTIETG